MYLERYVYEASEIRYKGALNNARNEWPELSGGNVHFAASMIADRPNYECLVIYVLIVRFSPSP